jgi:uncharacterized membrane protein
LQNIHSFESQLWTEATFIMRYLNWRNEMTKNIYAVLFVLIMIVVIVSVDLLFFRNRIWERLIANIGIVLVFVAFYLRFLKKL